MLTVVASTLSGNFGGAGTGIFNTGEGARVEIGDTILMNSFLLGAVNIAKVGGEVISDGCNLSSDGGVFNVGTGTCDLNATGDQINTDPMIGPLQEKGGPTFTQATTQAA